MGLCLWSERSARSCTCPLKGAKVAVQGAGNVGGTAARLLHREGCKVVALSDVSGGIYSEDGLDMDEIMDFLTAQRGRLLKDYDAPNLTRISNEELLTQDVDILIPAALENQITEEIAPHIKARIVVEGANGPTTVGGDRVLEEKGVVVVPDILANSGGVTVSYFEWVQNLQSFRWEEEEINNRLENIMIKAFNEVWNKAVEAETTLRMGAYMVAVDRIVTASKMRGLS